MIEETVRRVPSSVPTCLTLDLSEEMSLGSDITDPLFEWDHHCPLEQADFTSTSRQASIATACSNAATEEQLTINNTTPKPAIAMHTIHQELIDLKLQVAKQREQIDILSSKLSTSQVVNEVAKAENATLVDEITQARDFIETNSISKRFNPFSSIKSAPPVNNGGSMQMLIDTNTRLTIDNSRLEASVDAIRNSFQGYIKFVQRSSRADKESIDLLARENEELQMELNIPKNKNKKNEVHMSDCISKTSLESEDVIAVEENSHQEETPQEHAEPAATALQDTRLMNRFGIPEIKTSNNSVTERGEDNEDEYLPRRRSEGLLVDFGTRPRQQKEQNRRRVGRVNGRRWSSVVY